MSKTKTPLGRSKISPDKNARKPISERPGSRFSNKVIASFDIDAQKGFTPLCPDELPVVGGDDIVDALNDMASIAQFRLGSKDAHAPNADWVVEDPEAMLKPTGMANADLTWVSHCVVGTRGYELLDGLPSPVDYDFFVYKGIEKDLHPYGACYHDIAENQSTGAIEFIKGRGIDLVVIGGLALDFCVKHTAYQLKKAGIDVAIYLPASRAIDAPNLEDIINEIASNEILVLRDRDSLMALAEN